eukprot:s9240_g2.t1
MVLDLCHELYVSGQENVFWQPENEEHQRRRWLAPKVEAPKPVSKVPKPVPAAVPGQASTCAPVALTSERAHRTTQPSTMASYVVGQTSPVHELSRTYAVNATARSIAGFRQVPATRTLLAPAVSVLEKSRVPAFQRTIQHPAVPSIAGFRQVPATRTLLAPAVSVLEKSRVPAFQRTIQHPAVPLKQVHQTAPRVMMRVIQPAVYMPVQVQAAPQFAYPISRETSFLGYHPMAYPVYVNNRVVIVRA